MDQIVNMKQKRPVIGVQFAQHPIVPIAVTLRESMQAAVEF